MGAQNAVVGDDSFGTTLPETQVDQTQLQEEKKRAQFTQSSEFQMLKDHLNSRINFYQQYLPDGRAITSVDEGERGYNWLAANIVVGEFKAVLSSYEEAANTLKEQ